MARTRSNGDVVEVTLLVIFLVLMVLIAVTVL
jgi:hypothetical protein